MHAPSSDKNPQPGTFFEAAEETFSAPQKNVLTTREIYRIPGLQAACETLQSKLLFNPQTIFYPCCAEDITVHEAFPTSRVLHIDRDPSSISCLTNYGAEAIFVADASLYTPPLQCDLLVTSNGNSTVDRHFSTFVRPGGYLLAQEGWNADATEVAQFKDFVFVAALLNDKTKGGGFITDSLAGLYYSVSDDVEFNIYGEIDQKGCVNFALAEQLIEAALPIHLRKQSVIESYKDFLQLLESKDLETIHAVAKVLSISTETISPAMLRIPHRLEPGYYFFKKNEL